MNRPTWSDHLFGILVVVVASTLPARAQPDAAKLFADHCATCHGERRLGGRGPALLPLSLEGIDRGEVVRTIRDGRTATQTAGFADRLTSEEIDALATFVLAEPMVAPTWTEADITASRETHVPPEASGPTWAADPRDLAVVVEAGDHHVTVLDGGKSEAITRFASRYALIGEPRFTSDGRYAFFGSRDGWISKYDLWTLTTVAEVRTGLNLRNIALSADGQWVAAANRLPSTLTILSAADLAPAKIFDAADAGGTPSRISAVYRAPDRDSFVVALHDVPEIWEIGSTGGIAAPFPLRRIATREPIDDFFFDEGQHHLLGTARGGDRGVVIGLDDGAEVATLALPGMPHPQAAVAFTRAGRRSIAVPHLEAALISVIDLETWAVVATIPTAGPGVFLRTHETLPRLWAGSAKGPAKDSTQIIDKESLRIIDTLTPEPGRTVGHVAFDRTGNRALVSITESDGALVVYDTATLKPVKRLAMKTPIGSFDVFDTIAAAPSTGR